MDFERSIEDVIEALKHAKDSDQKCTLLIGAGCSVKAGIPTAAGLIKEIEKKFPRDFDRVKEKTYPNCMHELSLDDRRELIGPFIDKAKINWAHISIAQLMKEGYIGRVYTTNFDPLVARACAYVGLFPSIYDAATSNRIDTDYISEPAIVHLHGQHTGFVTLHTVNEFGEFAQNLGHIFSDVDKHRWIVCGYSGVSDPVFENFADVKTFKKRLYWIGYKDDEPPQHVRKHLLIDEKYAYYVRGYDADDFFVELAIRLKCFPPVFLSQPFSHLLDQFSNFARYTRPDTGDDILEDTRDIIKDAIREFEPKLNETIFLEPSNKSKVVLQITRRIMGGESDKVIKRAEEDPTFSAHIPPSLLAIAHFTKGYEFVSQAEKSGNEEAERLYKKACEEYEATLQFKPDYHEALTNWGAVLSKQAKTKSGEEADRLYEQAGKKYAAALKIKPDEHHALFNWGNTLAMQAGEKLGEVANHHYREAGKKYEAATKINPNMHEAFFNWGNALCEQAKTKFGEEAYYLYQEACEKFEAAHKIKSDMHEILNNWGLALVHKAKINPGEETDNFYQEAYKKYRDALLIKPKDHQIIYNWGLALSSQAERKSGEEADQLYQQACEKYEKALQIKPEDHQVLTNYGNALSSRAKILTKEESNQFYHRAYDMYKKAIEIYPDNHLAYHGWGVALADQAEGKSGNQADKLYQQACDKFKRVLEIAPNFERSLIDWGYALYKQAKNAKEKSISNRFLQLACEKYESALIINPYYILSLTNLADTLLSLARQTTGIDRERYLSLAEEKSAQAESIAPGTAAYNYACLCSLRGQEEDCQTWLQKSRDYNYLPSRKHLEEDSDLDNMRDKPWFREFLDSLPDSD